MQLITAEQRRRLLDNHTKNLARREAGMPELDFRPVVKLFSPVGAATWLLTELDAEDGDRAFGLCDLGFGCPELGYVLLSELASVRGPLGIGIERDRTFEATQTISAYAAEARRVGAIDA